MDDAKVNWLKLAIADAKLSGDREKAKKLKEKLLEEQSRRGF